MWPIECGRYRLGNLNSPVAVCTLSSIELDLPMHKIAIAGKCVLENVGIEKIVRNVVANPRIRFLILCGRESMGHFVGQSIKALKQHGVDTSMRIIGSIGAMPYLRNLSLQAVERFRQQVEVVDLIGVEDSKLIEQAVDECLQRDPGSFGKSLELKREVMEAWHEEQLDWKPDPLGHCLIHANPLQEQIVLEAYDPEGRLRKVIVGSNAESIAHTAIREGLISELTHAAYLGRELQKAEHALKLGLEYVQDSPLQLKRNEVWVNLLAVQNGRVLLIKREAWELPRQRVEDSVEHALHSFGWLGKLNSFQFLTLSNSTHEINLLYKVELSDVKQGDWIPLNLVLTFPLSSVALSLIKRARV